MPFHSENLSGGHSLHKPSQVIYFRNDVQATPEVVDSPPQQQQQQQQQPALQEPQRHSATESADIPLQYATPSPMCPQLQPGTTPAVKQDLADAKSPEPIETSVFRNHSPIDIDNDDDDEELERLARQEMDEEDIVDFSAMRLPPRPPPAVEHPALPVRPLMFSQKPPPHAYAATAPAPAPARRRTPSRSRAPEVPKGQQIEKRNVLVDCVLNGTMPSKSRCATPVRSSTPRRQHRSSSRGPAYAAQLEADYMPTKPATPRKKTVHAINLVGAPSTPRGEDFRHDPRPVVVMDSRMRKEQRPSVSSLPLLNGKLPKHQSSQKSLLSSGPPSARAWRGKAAAGIFP